MPRPSKAHDPLPSEDHVIRFVGWQMLTKDAEDNVTGIFPQAFQEAECSVTWLEHFELAPEQQFHEAVRAMRASQLSGKLGSKGRFAEAIVGEIVAAGKASSTKIRVIYMPEQNNHAHSEIHGLEYAPDELAVELASTVFGNLVKNGDVPP